MTPTVASIPTADIPIPYRPAVSNDTQIAAQIRSTGITTDSIPTARPAMMFVADPVSEAAAMRFTGLEAV